MLNLKINENIINFTDIKNGVKPLLNIELVLFVLSLGFLLSNINTLTFIPMLIIPVLFLKNVKQVKIDFDIIALVTVAFLTTMYAVLRMTTFSVTLNMFYFLVGSFTLLTIVGTLAGRSISEKIEEQDFFFSCIIISILIVIFWFSLSIYQSGFKNEVFFVGGIKIFNFNFSNIRLIYQPVLAFFVYLLPFYIKKYKPKKAIGYFLYFIAFIFSVMSASRTILFFLTVSVFFVYPIVGIVSGIIISSLSYCFSNDLFFKAININLNKFILLLQGDGRFDYWKLFIENINKIELYSSDLLQILYKTYTAVGMPQDSYHCFFMDYTAFLGYLGLVLSIVCMICFLYLAKRANLFLLGLICVLDFSVQGAAGECYKFLYVMVIFFYAMIYYQEKKKKSINTVEEELST